MNHYGDPKWQFVPEHPGTVRTVIFQLRTNGAPGFLRPFMTDDSKDANVSFFYPDHKGETIHTAVLAADAFIKENPMGEVIVRLDMDHALKNTPFFSREKLTDIWYYMLGPLLPPRNHTLHVQVKKSDGVYESIEVTPAETGDTAVARRVPRAVDRRLRGGAGFRRGRRVLLVAGDARGLGQAATSTPTGRARSTASAPSRSTPRT